MNKCLNIFVVHVVAEYEYIRTKLFEYSVGSEMGSMEDDLNGRQPSRVVE